MATYYSDRVNSLGTHAIKGGNGLIADFCTATDASTALGAADIIKLFTLPKGATVVGLKYGGTARNSGNDRVLTIGDADDTDRLVVTASGSFFRDNSVSLADFIAGNSTVNHSGTGSSVVMTKGLGYTYTADTDIIATITSAGTGNAADWVFNCFIEYYIAE